ncbi:Sugar kinase of the NBD/HSP70 family, may contain an N-terminal HTH domain [Herbiconiux ginsengi]|uniref:Sugar kinase of the NBD/HSP70 family, may contain an N-terminal HTH domain n=1 Tax=Herbiconiux ginsengi TaxID=381665 RepID=A0A1H3TNF9_9MICO|nr:Sugar kinase of the NBD/HSP70 family, may contain an N-terminal HTH domain [Herbiconiux ginsengi]
MAVAHVNPTPGSQSSLREANRGRIVDALKFHGRLTQVELAGATGLSPATVSNIVKELAAAGVLHTSTSTRSGRRAIQVSLARQLGLVAGLHFSSRHLRVAVSDTARTVVAETHVPLAADHRHDSELDRVTLLLTDMVESLGASLSDLLAIGVGLPAPVDTRSNTVAPLGLLRNWEGVDIADSLSRRTGAAVFVDSEANLGAIAETRGDLRRIEGVAAYIRVGHTISAGLVVNGVPFRGMTGKAGQIGHITIDENGPICRCGNRGCLETLAGGRALLDLFRGDPSIQRLSDLIVRAENGDPSSSRVIADAGRHIGIAAASLCNLLDPDRIIIGGELAETGEILIAPLRHALERSALGGTTEAPEVTRSLLGDRSELMGALALAIEHVALDAEGRLLENA